MPNEIVRPFKSSVKIDNERNLEMQADLTNKTAEVVNLVNGENWTAGGESDFSTAEVTFKADSTPYHIGGITVIASKAGAVVNTYEVEPGTDLKLVLPLYKGNADIYIDVFGALAEDFTPVCTGDVEAAEFGFKVTGNGSITLDGKRIT